MTTVNSFPLETVAASTILPPVQWTYSSTTDDADPGAGKFRLNNATPASATAAYIDNEEIGGTDVSDWLDTFDDGGASTKRGTLTINSTDDTSIFYIFNVTGSVVDGTGYRKLTIAYIAGSGVLTDGHVFTVTFTPRTATIGTDVVGTADTDVSGYSFVLDEDDMASDSATKVPTQQSVKAYVDGMQLNVLSFGATGDGTDQTTEFQDTIDSTTDGDRVRIFVPPGSYTISTLTTGTRIMLWELGAGVTITGTLPGTVVNGVFTGIAAPTTLGPYAFADKDTASSRDISGISPLRVQRTSNHTSTASDDNGFAFRVISSVGANVGNNETGASITATHGTGAGASGQHVVALTAEVDRTATSNASSFGGNIVAVDESGLKSSASGAAVIGLELDISASLDDDSDIRIILECIGKKEEDATDAEIYCGARIRSSDDTDREVTLKNGLIIQAGSAGGAITNGIYLNAAFAGGAAIDIDATAAALVKIGSNIASGTAATIEWIGHNDAATPERIAYVKSIASVVDDTDGSEDGKFEIQTMRGGTSTAQATFGDIANIKAFNGSDDDAVQAGRNSSQYVSLSGSTGGNEIASRSQAASAKVLTINATTDSSDTTPTGGLLGIRLQIAGVTCLEVTDDGDTKAIMNTGLGTDPLDTSWIAVAAGNASKSQLNFASSVAPTSPVNGDIWFDGTDLKIQVSGATKTFTLA